MRRIGIALSGMLAAFAIIAFSVYRIEPSHTVTKPVPTPAVLGKPSSSLTLQTMQIDHNGIPLTIKASYPLKAKDIILYSNLEKTETSVEIMTQLTCDLLVNGTFYTTENTHGGLFVTEYELRQPFVSNDTYNSVFSINDYDTPRITRSQPKDQLRMALQTGPLLWENGAPQTVTMRNDKLARRSVVAVTGTNEVVFITLYNSKSAFAGPYLEDVPELLRTANDELNLSLADATNLDGGTASVFMTNDFALPEASVIGSYFCVSENSN